MATVQQLRDYLAANPSDLLTWTPTENFTGTNVYAHLYVFYFVLDLAPVSSLQTAIEPSSTAPWTWLSNWLINYSLELGSFMNTPASLTPESLQTFYDSPPYNMLQYNPNSGPWKTFDEFFARHINPSLRPIDCPTEPTIIVSPADSYFDGWWCIDQDANITFADSSKVASKGLMWSIAELLKDTPYGPSFAGGQFAHSFLSPTDYHRQHAPVSGKVLYAQVIHGQCYLQVVPVVDDKAPNDGPPTFQLDMKRNWSFGAGVGDSGAGGAPPLNNSLDAPDTPGYQFLQSRGLIIIDSSELGLVAVLPMGMAQVLSVVLSVEKDDVVNKGDKISYFQFGGSDIVLVFQKDANVDSTASINSHYTYGNTIATASPTFSA